MADLGRAPGSLLQKRGAYAGRLGQASRKAFLENEWIGGGDTRKAQSKVPHLIIREAGALVGFQNQEEGKVKTAFKKDHSLKK